MCCWAHTWDAGIVDGFRQGPSLSAQRGGGGDDHAGAEDCGGGVSKKPREDRNIGIATIALSSRPETERSVPRTVMRIDGLWWESAPSTSWGALRPVLRERPIILEHFSGAVRVGQAVRSLAKAGFIALEWFAELDTRIYGPSTQPRSPVVLLFTEKTARKVRAWLRLSELAPGIHRSQTQFPFEFVLVELHDVDPRESGLHLLRLPSGTEGASTLARFLDNGSIDPEIRREIEEAMMNQELTSTADEHELASVRVRREGREEGRHVGRVEGIVDSILMVAEARGLGVDGSARARIASLDEAALRVLLRECATSESIDAAFKAAT